MFDREVKNRMKLEQQKQNARTQIRELDKIIGRLDEGMTTCATKVREAVNRGDTTTAHMFANSWKFNQNRKVFLERMKSTFENYLIQVEINSSFVNIKDIYKNAASLMDSMPSMKKNNKDFMKMKKSMMKGQLSMESMSSMMSDMDPALDTKMDESEFNGLLNQIGVTMPNNIASNTATNAATETASNSEDLFNEINL